MKLKVKIIIICSFALYFCLNQSYGQNNFSQIFSAPLTINPSNTGKFLGDYRIGGNYRDQPERSSFSSYYSFFADIKIFSSRLAENDQMAIGILGLGEKNEFNGIRNNSILVSISFSKSLNEDGTESLTAAFQIDFAHKKIDPPLLVFEDQMIGWFNSGFNGINPFEKRIINTNYIGVNLGLSYQKLINSRHHLGVGVSVANVNSPYKRDGEIIFSLSPKLSLQADFETILPNKNKLFFLLNASDITNKKSLNEIGIGAYYQLSINESKYKLNVGCLYNKRKLIKTSISPLLGIKYGHYNLNFSYDISSSNNNTHKKGGGFEAGLIFIGRRNNKNL